MDEEVVSRDLVPAFVKLLKDTEAEVRTAIAGQIPGFCSLIDRNVLLNDIMGSIEDLVSDSSQHVRAALGTQISGLAPILGKQESVSFFFPFFFYLYCTPYTGQLLGWRVYADFMTGPLIISFPCSSRC